MSERWRQLAWYNNFINFAMFSNKKPVHNRSSRLQASNGQSTRSTTPQHDQKNNSLRISQSQSKPQQPVIMLNQPSLLSPIAEQMAIDHPYYLGRGNNHEVIKRVIETRKGWGEVSSNTQFSCFRWVQNSYSFKFHLLGKQCYCFNHFEYHRELSNKQRLVNNLINFCEANKMNAYSFLPVSFIIDLNTGEEDLALHAFIKFFNRNYPEEGGNKKHSSVILPRNKYLPYLTAQQLNKRSQGNFYCKPFCPKSFIDQDVGSYLWILKPTFLNRGRGVALFKELDELQKLIWKYYEGEGLEDFADKYPNNPSLTKLDTESELKGEKGEKSEQQKDEIEQGGQQRAEKEEKSEKERKEEEEVKKEPVEVMKMKKIESNKTDSLKNTSPSYQKIEDDSPNYMTASSPTKQGNNPARCMSFVIQKYIEKPMLIEGRKFDIRIWALLTQNMEVYIFQEGYLRFSSQLYSTKDNHTNPFIHLTNNSVQKYSEKYDKDSGNQDALSSIFNYLPANKADSIYKSIVAKIKEIVWLSMCAARRKININSRRECFQLFGYDFMIDYDYKVWLIEVNTNPSLDESSPLLKQLIPRMINDMFKLTIDKIFNNKMKEDAEEFRVEGVKEGENMWEFLGDMKEGANERNGKRLTFARR